MFESDIIDMIIQREGYHKRAPEYGERAWIAKGKYYDVIYWDNGNGWCNILGVIPKKVNFFKKEIERFYIKLRMLTGKHFDQKM